MPSIKEIIEVLRGPNWFPMVLACTAFILSIINVICQIIIGIYHIRNKGARK